MDSYFKGKRALVTGAGKGIGRSLVKALTEQGATTYALSRTEADLASLKAECPEVNTICVDLSDWDSTRQAVTSIGPVDLLVNNAAVAQLGSFLDVTPDDFDASFNINVKQVINVSQVVARTMIERRSGGSIVNVSSQASIAALKDHAVYCGTKGALDAVTRVMALELGAHNIRVNSVNPTVVMTAMGRIGWSDPVKAESMLSKIPLRRFAEVDDVVSTIIFLLSDKAAMISGVSLPIDGGFTAC